MGLSKLWSTFTGPKVKEITPQEKCKWLEQPRPVTSSGQRFTKSNISLPLDAEAAASKRSTTTSDDKSSIFKSRRGWRRRKSLSGIRPSPTKDAPQVPDLVSEPEPVPFTAPETRDTNEAEDELERPGTALTIDEIDLAAANHVFELPATSVVPAKTEHESELASRPATRKRSKSSASEKPRQKRASWYSIGRWRDDGALPPPLPSSELEPPVANNTEAPSIIELPVYDANAPILPASQSFRDSLGAESILRAFPSVPSLKSEDPVRTPTTPTLRDSAVVTPPTHRKPTLGIPDVHKPLPSPKSFSQPLSPVLGPDGFPRPPSNPASIDGKLKPRRSSVKSQKSSRHHSSKSDDGFLSKEQQREYNRVTRFLEGMDQSKRTSGVVGVVTDVDDPYFPAPPPPPLHPAEQKFSNDAALAALEFGIGGEQV